MVLQETEFLNSDKIICRPFFLAFKRITVWIFFTLIFKILNHFACALKNISEFWNGLIFLVMFLVFEGIVVQQIAGTKTPPMIDTAAYRAAMSVTLIVTGRAGFLEIQNKPQRLPCRKTREVNCHRLGKMQNRCADPKCICDASRSLSLLPLQWVFWFDDVGGVINVPVAVIPKTI